MKVIKRNKTEVEFDGNKIYIAISKANTSTILNKLTDEDITRISNLVIDKCMKYNHAIDIEDIQNIVEDELMNAGANDVAKNYITYRYQHMLDRNLSTLEDKIMSIVELKNEEVFQENSNKNPVINSTQRDYIAGEVSRDISMKKMFSKEVAAAHSKGIIHIHDTDYLIQPMHNCDLLDLEDMLQNGTIISNTLIEPPKSFSTACNIATQIIAQVASNQYGGQTITLTHLAPFVDVSRQKIRRIINEEFEGIDISKEKKEEIVEKRVRDEIKKGVQTIQYQVLTLLTTNGQTPFISICMYLNEAKDQRTKDDLALIIEEMLIQRIQGVKNEKNVWITPAFPKLLYILEEDNITEDGKYYYLTELAAKCSAKRMVPDYISEKKMLEYKIDKNGNGNCYPCMGCVDGKETINIYYKDKHFENITFEEMWDMMSHEFEVKHQFDIPKNPNLCIGLSDVKIYDTNYRDFVQCHAIIRNVSEKWINITFNNGTTISCTTDHPFEIKAKGQVHAENLEIGDLTLSSDPNGEVKYIYVTDKSEVITIDSGKYSYDVCTYSKHFEVSGIYSHNCRSFLTPYVDEDGKSKYYGRFNQGVVSINLPYIALLSKKDMNKFWEELDHYLELCHDALMSKHKRLLGTISDVAPILWQYGALARLNKGEKIDKLLFGGYSTISLGYAGLYECVKYMTGKSHTDEEAKPFALSVMQKLNNKCKEWKAKHNIDFSVYGSPIESVTYKFAKANRDTFGEIEEVTDHNYVTNSYHVSVREPIDAFSKLKFEADFQKLSPGGAISYIEVPNMQNNIPAVIEVIKFIYDNIMYAEINTKSDYCMKCGYDGEIQIIEENGKLIWECPNCKNRDQSKMSVARRTCGYIGTNFWNQGRTQEIKERVLHL